MIIKTILAFILILAASILPDQFSGTTDALIFKVIFLTLAAVLFLMVRKLRDLWKLPAVLLMINLSFLLIGWIRDLPWWGGLFTPVGILAKDAGFVAVKIIGIIPVAALLLILQKKPSKAYLSPGSLAVKADRIVWLGISGGRIPWGRLAVISGLLIVTGTILLSLLTRIGFRTPAGLGRLLPNLPVILVMAAVNSFCEGLVYRSAVMGPVRGVLPKLAVTLLPALFFGIAHFEGIPGGLLGAVMSGLLGYYMSLSMFETDGFASGWIIHGMQDFAVFSTLVLFGSP